MAKRSYGMTRRTMEATLPSSSSSSRVSDVRVATSSRKSSRSLRSRNRTAGLRGAAISGFFHDADARARTHAIGPRGDHGFEIRQRADAAGGFDAHRVPHRAP